MTANQDIELKSPAEAILKAYDSSLDGAMAVTERLGLVETKSRTVAKAAETTRQVSVVLTTAVAQVIPEQLQGLEAWRDIYVAIQNIILFTPGSGRRANKTYSTLAMKHLADLTFKAGELIQNLMKAIGKMLSVMGIRAADFSPKPRTMGEFRKQVVTLTEEYFYEHLFSTPARTLVFRTLPHMTLFRSLTHATLPIPHNFLHAIMTGHGVARASSKIAGGSKPMPKVKAYFALLCQAERLLNRLVAPNQQTAITQDKWNREIVEGVGVGSQTAIRTLFKTFSDAMVAEPDPIDTDGEDEEVEANEVSLEDLWANVSPVKEMQAKAPEEPKKRAHKKQKTNPAPAPAPAPAPEPEPEERTEERARSEGTPQLTILDVSVNDMQLDQTRCQEWVSQQNEEVYLKHRFRDEPEPVVGKITDATFNKNAGYATWTVTMNDTREAKLDISEVIASVQYYRLWREGQRAKGIDPEELMRKANKSKPTARAGVASKKGKTGKVTRTGVFNVRVELRKLNKADKKDLDQWLEDIDSAAPGFRYLDSDDSEGEEVEEDETDHTDITRTFRGERFKLLRDAAQTPATTNSASLALRGNTRIAEKCAEVNGKCRSEYSLDLPHEVILSIVFGANKRLSSFAALIGMGTDISEEASAFGVEQAKDVITQAPSGGWVHTSPTRDLRKKKNLETAQDCLEATMYFALVLNSWHAEAWKFTQGLAQAMKRTITKSKSSTIACLSLLQTMWTTWCSSIDKVISLATRGGSGARNGYYLCDMAIHHRCHLVVLKDDYWDTRGAEECRDFKNKENSKETEKLRTDQATLTAQLQSLQGLVSTLQKAKGQGATAAAAAGAGAGLSRQATRRQKQQQQKNARKTPGSSAKSNPAPAPAPSPAPTPANRPQRDPALGAAVRVLQNPAAVKAAMLAAGFASLAEAQKDFKTNDNTALVNGLGACFWAKSPIGQVEGRCPYGAKCNFQH